MEQTINENNILLAQTVLFSHNDQDLQKLIKVPGSTYLRMVVFIDHILLDLETGNEVKMLKFNKERLVEYGVYANTIYALVLYKCPEVNEEDLEQAYNVYENYLEKNKLIKKGKVLTFPQKRIY